MEEEATTLTMNMTMNMTWNMTLNITFDTTHGLERKPEGGEPTSQELQALYQLLEEVTFGMAVSSLIFLVLGLFSNFVAASALWSRIEKISTFNYLFALAIFDALYLTFYNMFWVPKTFFSIDIRHYLSCGFASFLVYGLGQMSSWCLAACCAERALTVCFPTKAKIWFSPKCARITVVLIIIIVCAANWHQFGGTRITSNEDGDIFTVCEGRTPEVNLYLHGVYPWVDMCMYSLIPGIILIISTSLIIWSFIKARSTVAPINPANNTMNKVALRTTRMSIALAAAFLLNTLPVVICLLAYQTGPTLGITEVTGIKIWIAAYIFAAIGLSNHFVNLYIYMVFSKCFRDDVRKIITCNWRAMVAPYPGFNNHPGGSMPIPLHNMNPQLNI